MKRGFKSYGLWRRVVGWVDPDVSKDLIAFIFKGQAECDCLTLEDEGHTFFRNVGKHTHNKASHPRRPEFSETRIPHSWLKFFKRPTYIFIFFGCFMYVLCNYMEQSPTWEANSSSAGEEVPRLLCKPKFSLPHSHVPTTCPYPDQDQPSPCPITLFGDPF